jgi:hypothetical protein
MHRGFKLTLNWKDEDYYQKGLVDFETDKTSIRKTLSEFIGKDGILHGSRLQATWFHSIRSG